MVDIRYVSEAPIFDHLVDEDHYTLEIGILTRNGYEHVEREFDGPDGQAVKVGILTRQGRVIKVYEL